VSGYFYHLWTEEKWAHVSKQEFGGKSYLEYLNSLSKEEGLLVEMMRFANYDLRHMVAWDYQDPTSLRYATKT